MLNKTNIIIVMGCSVPKAHEEEELKQSFINPQKAGKNHTHNTAYTLTLDEDKRN